MSFLSAHRDVSCWWTCERREGRETEGRWRRRRWRRGWGRGRKRKHEQEEDRDVRQQHTGRFLQGVMDPCSPDRGTRVCLQWLLMLPASVSPPHFTSRMMWAPSSLANDRLPFNINTYLSCVCFGIYRQTDRVSERELASSPDISLFDFRAAKFKLHYVAVHTAARSTSI